MDIVRNLFTYMLGNGLSIILGVLMNPILTRLISNTEMGKYSMFTTVASFLTIFLCVGMDQVYVRYYYEYSTKTKKYIWHCIRIPLLLTTAINLIVLLFYGAVSQYIVGESSFAVAGILIIYNYGSVFERFALTQIRMRQKSKKYSGIQVATKLAYFLLALLLYLIWRDCYLTLICATVGSNILLAIYAVFSEKEAWLRRGEEKINLGYTDMLKYGAPLIFSTTITLLFQYMDKIMLRSFCDYGELGIYTGAMLFITILNAAQSSFTTFWTPVAYKHFNEQPENTQFFCFVNEGVACVMMLLSVWMIGAKDIVILLLGKSYRDAAFVFPFLVLMPIMYTVSETTVMGINFMKKTQYHIIVAVICVLFNGICNYLLIPVYGAKGAALATGLSYVVFFAVRTWLSKKVYPVNYSLGKLVFSTILVYALAFYSSFHTLDTTIVTMVIISTVLILVVYRSFLEKTCKMVVERHKHE